MRKIFTAQTLRAVLAGAAGGAANGFFGSGGGLLSVPALESGGLETKKAHATSLAIMLPLSVVSAAVYMKNGSLDATYTMEFDHYAEAPKNVADAVIAEKTK